MSTVTISDVLYVPDNSSSILLTTDNYQEHAFLSADNYHTTLGDITSRELLTLLDHIDRLIFIDIFDHTSDIYKETVVLLNYISHFRTVENFSVDPTVTFTDHTGILDRPDEPVIWVYGCSHTYGYGLRSDELNYATILSQELGMPLKLIAKCATSTNWSLRHLLNTPFRPGDRVVWQLTTPNRVTRFEEDGADVEEVQLARTQDRHLLEVYNDNQTFFNHINFLNTGVQYLRSQNVDFVLTSLMIRMKLFYNYMLEYTKYPEYCYSPEFEVDLGTDNVHVGPRSHQNLANAILTHMKQNKL